MRPMADVSTAPRTKLASASGRSAFRSCRLDQRQSERWQALRHLPEQRDALSLEIQQPRRENAGDYDEKRHRPVLQPQFAGNENREGGAADEQGGPVRVAEMRR